MVKQYSNIICDTNWRSIFSPAVFLLFFLFTISPRVCASLHTCDASLTAKNRYAIHEDAPSLRVSMDSELFSGRVPIPVGQNYFQEGDWDGYGVPVRAEKILSMPRRLRQFVHDLKIRSLTMTKNEREMSAFIVIYKDGTSSAIKYTANSINSITAQATDSALDFSKIFEKPDAVAAVIHVHTHPDTRNPLTPYTRFIGPNDVDYGTYITYKKWLQHFNKDISMMGIVAPSCEFCDDTIFVVTDQMLDAFEHQESLSDLDSNFSIFSIFQTVKSFFKW